jgi:hypothetical protein
MTVFHIKNYHREDELLISFHQIIVGFLAALGRIPPPQQVKNQATRSHYTDEMWMTMIHLMRPILKMLAKRGLMIAIH